MVLSMLDISCDTYFAKIKYVSNLTFVSVMRICRYTDTYYFFFINNLDTSTSTVIHTMYAGFMYYATLSYGMLSVYFIVHIFMLYLH